MNVPPLKHRAPTRYYSRMVELGVLEALGRLLKYRQWSWQKVTWDEVYMGDPRYEAAPYEEVIILDDDINTMTTKIKRGGTKRHKSKAAEL